MVLPLPQCKKHFCSLNATFQGAPTETLEKRLKLMREDEVALALNTRQKPGLPVLDLESANIL